MEKTPRKGVGDRVRNRSLFVGVIYLRVDRSPRVLSNPRPIDRDLSDPHPSPPVTPQGP